MEAVAVAGEPGTTFPATTAVPSSVKLTVPVGSADPYVEAETVAVTCNELPAVGEVVTGLIATVVEILATVTVTAGELAAA